jgi:hypothetical protein
MSGGFWLVEVCSVVTRFSVDKLSYFLVTVLQFGIKPNTLPALT